MNDTMGILLIIGFIALVVFLHIYRSPAAKGKRGEKCVRGILEGLSGEYLLINDVVLKTSNGTTQIDHVVVSKYGVFAIETKNYRGEIYGDDKRQEWTQIIATDVHYLKKWYKTYTYITKNYFYNPVWQAKGHARELQKLLTSWPHLKVIPIVIFVGKVNINKVYSSTHVVYDDEIVRTILSYQTAFLSDAEVQQILGVINQSNVRALVSNSAHVKNVKAAQQSYDNKIKAGICPRCGGQLVERSGHYGRFLGCSNYPKCKFTYNF